MNRIKGESQESTRYFVFASHEKTGSPTKLERSEVTRYLRGLLIADYGEGNNGLISYQAPTAGLSQTGTPGGELFSQCVFQIHSLSLLTK